MRVVSLTTFLIAAGILTVAAFAQAVTGFGFALGALALCSLVALARVLTAW